ncbi:MAG TPA: HAD-IIIA family hydrolase [Ruminiclostridium sp.]|nr:HAD-IIIA family hydrolase [Ruminiclostridium sp.]
MAKEDDRLWYHNCVNAGIHMFSNHIFDKSYGLFRESKKVDLDREVLRPLIPSGKLFVYDSPEYVMDMGTPDRYYAVTEDIRNGKVQAKNLTHKQKAIFLDRDGTINKYIGFLTDIEDFALLPGAAQAIKLINQSGCLVIVVTNQPVIARGEVSLEGLQEIHNKMETLLGRDGAYLDAIYYCPHHPDKGFEGERAEYKIECGCRKPKPGLLLKAAEDYNIDLSQSWMVGDGDNDVMAGKSAGCRVAYLGNGKTEVPCFDNLLQFVRATL